MIQKIREFKDELRVKNVDVMLFYAAFALFSFFIILLRYSMFKTFLGFERSQLIIYVEIVVTAILFVKFLLQKLTIRRFLVSCIMVALGLASYIATKEDFLLFTFIFLATSERIKIQTLAKISLICALAILIIVISSYKAHIIETKLLTSNEGISRNSLGFSHPNALGLIAILICMDVATICFGKRIWPTLLVSLVAIPFIYFVPYSRTTILIIAMIMITVILCKLLQNRPKVLIILSACIFVLILLFTFIPMIVYDASNGLLVTLNQFLSERLRLAHYYFTEGVPLLFGNGYIFNAEDGAATPIDMAFARLLLFYGMLPALVFIALIVASYVLCYKEKCFNAVALGFTIFLFYGLSECLMLEFAFNYFLIFLAPALYGEKLSDFGQSIEKIDITKSLPTHAKK